MQSGAEFLLSLKHTHLCEVHTHNDSVSDRKNGQLMSREQGNMKNILAQPVLLDLLMSGSQNMSHSSLPFPASAWKCCK